MDQTFMKEKPVMPLVISMALPMTISMLVNALYNIVDSYFVAKISEDSMTAIIAFYLGAKKSEAANQAASMGMLFNIIHGILLNIGCIAVMPAFLRIFTKDSNILKMGLDYSNIVFMFTIPISISISFEKIFQSVGNMKVSMICMILGCVTNIILDPLFIFGIGFIPELGIKGAAIATCIGQLVTLSGYIIAYFVRPIPAKIRIEYMKFDSTLCKKMYAIGIPATLNLALPSIQISALNGILSAYSAGYVLVLGSYYKLQTFLYLTVNGVVQGMRPLIGYNYGAGEKKRVRDIFKSALILIVGVMVIGTILCLIIPDKLIGLFTNKANTIEIGKTALRIISLGFIVSSVPVAVSGALEGLGKGKESLVISILRYIVIMISLAFFISRIVGATGVWHAFWITEVFMAVISGVICKKQILK